MISSHSLYGFLVEKYLPEFDRLGMTPISIGQFWEEVELLLESENESYRIKAEAIMLRYERKTGGVLLSWENLAKELGVSSHQTARRRVLHGIQIVIGNYVNKKRLGYET